MNVARIIWRLRSSKWLAIGSSASPPSDWWCCADSPFTQFLSVAPPTRASTVASPALKLSTALQVQPYLINLFERPFLLWYSICSEVYSVNWETVTTPKTLGGLGIRKTVDVNAIAMVGLCWRIMQEEEKPWVKILNHKYVDSLTTRHNKRAILNHIKGSMNQKSLIIGVDLYN